MRGLVAALAIVASTIAAAPSPAEGQEDAGCEAQGCRGGTVTASDETLTTHVMSSEPGQNTSQTIATAPAWLQTCNWNTLTAGTTIPADFEALETGPFDEDMWIVTCPRTTLANINLGDLTTGILDIFPLNNPPADIIQAVINEARDQAPLIAFYPESAPAGSTNAPMITQLETWLWIDDADWQPVTSTASIPPLSVTATATPTTATWTGGDDPHTITCGQGVPYDFSRTEEDRPRSDCTTFFRNSSAVADYSLTLTVTWDITYQCSAFCGAGTLPSATTTSTRPVRVAELQAIVTSSGST